jgi:hypothetical protein
MDQVNLTNKRLNHQGQSLKNLMQVARSLLIHPMRMMRTLRQDPPSHPVFQVEVLLMMTMTTSEMKDEVGRTRRARRRTEKLAEDGPDADVGVTHPHLHHHLLRLPRPVRILRVPLHVRLGKLWSILGHLILRPKSLIGC